MKGGEAEVGGREVTLSQAFAAAFERNAPRWVDGQRLDPSHPISLTRPPLPPQPNHLQSHIPSTDGIDIRPSGPGPGPGFLRGTGDGIVDTNCEGLFKGRKPSMAPPLSFPISLNSTVGQDPFSRAVSPIGRKFSMGTEYFKSVEVDQHPIQQQTHHLNLANQHPVLEGNRTAVGEGDVPSPNAGRSFPHSSGMGQGDIKLKVFPFTTYNIPQAGSGTCTPSSISADTDDPSIRGLPSVAVVDYAFSTTSATSTNDRYRLNISQNRLQHQPPLQDRSQQPTREYWTQSPPSPRSQSQSQSQSKSHEHSQSQANPNSNTEHTGSSIQAGMNGRRPSLHTFLGTSLHTPLFPDHLSRPFFSWSGTGDQSPTLFNGPMDHDQDHDPRDHDPHSQTLQPSCPTTYPSQESPHSDPRAREEEEREGGGGGGEAKGASEQPYVPVPQTLERDMDRTSGRRMSVFWPNVGAVGRLSLSKGGEGLGLGLGLGLDMGGDQWK